MSLSPTEGPFRSGVSACSFSLFDALFDLFEIVLERFDLRALEMWKPFYCRPRRILLPLGGGADCRVGPVSLEPFINLHYLLMHSSSFTELGAGALDLNVHQRTAQMLRSEVGLG